MIYGIAFRMIIIIYMILWLKYYFTRLPSDIRDIKKKRELDQTRNDQSVLSQFKSEELKKLYSRDCQEEYHVTLFNFVLFWIINLIIIIILYAILIQPLFVSLITLIVH